MKRKKAILVGGPPRSGTTAVSRLLGLNKSTISAGTELGIIRHVRILESTGHLNAKNKSQICSYTVDWLSQVSEQLSWNIDRFKLNAHEFKPRNILENESKIILTAEAICNCLLASSDASVEYKTIKILEILLDADILNNELQVACEKTPDNSLYLKEAETREFSLTKLIVVMRDPIATICSMRTRAADNDPWSEGFRGYALKLVWIYISHLRILESLKPVKQDDYAAIINYQDNSNIITVNYDKMTEAPLQAAAEIALATEMEISNEFIANVKNNITLNKSKHVKHEIPNNLFSQEEIRLLKQIEPILKSKYGMIGSEEWSDIGGTLSLFEEPLIVACQGIGMEINKAWAWMSRQSVIGIATNNADNEIKLEFHLPESAPFESIKIAISFVSLLESKCEEKQYVEIRKGSTVGVLILLQRNRSTLLTEFNSIYFIELEADLSYMPCIIADNNPDKRLLSALIKPSIESKRKIEW